MNRPPNFKDHGLNHHADAARSTVRPPGIPSTFKQASRLLLRHPAYLFSRFWSLYARYERARMRGLQRRGLSAVFCMGMFYIIPDAQDSNTGVTSSILLRDGNYEPESSAVFAQLMGRGDTILDIGANIGWYTLLAAKIVGSAGQVVALEPEPHNFQLLRASIRLNRLQNVTVLEKCASDRSEETVLNISTSNAGGHSIVAGGLMNRGLRVNSTTLDELVKTLGLEHVDVIKMDAESAEPLIFLGATKVLARGDPRAILMEFSPRAWVGYKGLLNSLLTMFRAYEIENSTLRPVSVSTLPTERQTMLLLTRRQDVTNR